MIRLDNIGKGFLKKNREVQWVFRHINVVFPDCNVGILGKAGSGKSTLIDLLSGNDLPSEGEIRRKGRVSWPYNYRGNVANRLTGRQNLRFLCEIYGRDFQSTLDFVCDFGDFDRQIDMPLKQYTGEAKNRFSACALLAMQFDCVLIDDNMALGETNFRRKCVQYLKDHADQMRLIIATSDRQLVMRHCEVGAVLDGGRLKIHNSIQEAVLAFSGSARVPA